DVFLNVCGIMLGYILIRFLPARKFKRFKVKPTS
ncbi:TPA: VanZ family protein, partial [Listeria innocua]